MANEMNDQQSSYKFLITGGGGFIGFHIGLRLLQLKHEVILYDINYPSKKWDSALDLDSTTGIQGKTEELFCSYGKIKFFKGEPVF